MIPEFDGYPSRSLPGGGRAYRIVGETFCAAYPVTAPADLTRAGVTRPYSAFCFYEADGVGTWHAALQVLDVQRYMDLYRMSVSATARESLVPRFAPPPPDPPPTLTLPEPA